MKRQIKFRGKSINNGEWVYGVPLFSKYEDDDNIEEYSCIVTGGDHNPTTGFSSPDNECFIDVITDTVGQFTGLLDKNGKEIYEGDISQDKLGRISICEFHHGGYWVRTIETSYSERLHSDSQIEVVGNIHDNPELLKGGKE